MRSTKTKRIFGGALLCMAVVAGAKAQEQQQVFDAYREAAGDNALLYSGKVAGEYIPQQYANHPFWDTDKFQEGSICLNGLLYTNQQLRYDAHTKQLSIQLPEKRLALLVEMFRVDYFVMNGKKFVRRGDDFVALLYDTPRMKLLQQTVCTLGTSVVKNYVSYKSFDRTVRYRLQWNGEEYAVSNRASVLKLFPEHKKALKRYANEEHLDFRKQRAEALVSIISYANLLIQKD